MSATATVPPPAGAGVVTWVHRFASVLNPYSVCKRCRCQVTAQHDARRCGCGPGDYPGANVPCGHAGVGVESVCPTWGALGCQCRAKFRRVDHPPIAWLRDRKPAAA